MAKKKIDLKKRKPYEQRNDLEKFNRSGLSLQAYMTELTILLL